MIVLIGIIFILFGTVQFFRALYYVNLSKYSENIEHAKFLKSFNKTFGKGI